MMLSTVGGPREKLAISSEENAFTTSTIMVRGINAIASASAIQPESAAWAAGCGMLKSASAELAKPTIVSGVTSGVTNKFAGMNMVPALQKKNS